MYKTLNQSKLGGGVRLPHDTINARVKHYIEKKLHRSFATIDPVDRQNIMYVLIDKFGYTQKELQDLFLRCRATIYNDISSAKFCVPRSKRRIYNTKVILDYILYNDKYIYR